MSEETTVSAPDPGSLDPQAQVQPSVRAQLLATEHWSLLAQRSTTQAEVLTRISIFLTLTSAGLVSLALAGQAMNFDRTFVLLAVVILVVVIIVGQLTQIRVVNIGFEDLSCVLAMNRLRAAYAELDPGIVPYLTASRFDDEAGSQATYYMLPRRTTGGHVAGSSMALIIMVNAVLVGLLFACVPAGLGGNAVLALTVGVIAGLCYVTCWMWVSGRRYASVWKVLTPRFPSPGTPAHRGPARRDARTRTRRVPNHESSGTVRSAS